MDTSRSINGAWAELIGDSLANRQLAMLHPAYFAMVMATGIVSLACHLCHLDLLATLLFRLNIGAYLLLLLLYVVRALRFPAKFGEDCCSHKRAFGFFTFIAATNVLASQFLQMHRDSHIAGVLWCIGLLGWVLCTYGIFVLLIVKSEKPQFEESINGGWLLASVATQSIVVTGTQLYAHCNAHNAIATSIAGLGAFALLSFWLFGSMIYLWVISLIFYRYMFFKFDPSDLIPPYWINMGAMAISALAGAEIINTLAVDRLIHSMLPFIKGSATLYWATATWWIPMLFALGVWRHGVRRFKFVYDPLYWGLVFPLGMYSVCTYKLSIALQLPALAPVAPLFLLLAITAWLTTFLSMAQRPLLIVIIAIRHLSATIRAQGGKVHE